jgi:hypothetical protein
MALLPEVISNFWDWFTSVGTKFDAPWLCIGDFNYVLSQSEKLGRRLVNNSSTRNFRSFVDQLGMINLGFAGSPFTWCNNRQGFATIKERLDRGLASQRCIHLHPEFALLHIPAYNSDHNPFPSIPTTTPLSSIDHLGLRNFGPMMPLVEKLLRRLGILLCVAIPPSISIRNSKTPSLPCCLGIPLILVIFRRKSSSLFISLIYSSKPHLVLLLLIRS